MIDPFLALTPVCVAGVLALVRFAGCNPVFGLDETILTPPGTPMVDFVIDPSNPLTARTDFTGWVGMLIQPQSDVVITDLGRWRTGMSTASHQVKLVDGATGANLMGGIAIVSLGGGPDESFVFASLNARVVLAGGGYYYLVSEETANTDAFYDFALTVTPTSDFIVPSAAYSVSGGPPYTQKGGVNNCYGPVNARYKTL